MVLTIPRGIALTGRVIDKNGKALSGVTVSASAGEGGSSGPGPGGMGRVVQRRMMMAFRDNTNDDDAVRTGSDGAFTIRLKEGLYDVDFKREGFAAKLVRGTQVNPTTKPLEVTLDPGVEITGRVTRGGNPVQGVNVAAAGETQAFTTTDSDGRFTLGDLTPGTYMVVVNKLEDFIQQMKTLNAPSKDVAIELPSGGRVIGHVVDKSTHQPITSFQAGITNSRSAGGMMIRMPPMMKSFTSDDGSFSLDNVPAGNMQVTASAPGYTTGRVPTTAAFQLSLPCLRFEHPIRRVP